MKTLYGLQVFILLTITTFFSSCTVIGDIFKAGMGFGIFIVLLVIGLIIFIIAKMGKK